MEKKHGTKYLNSAQTMAKRSALYPKEPRTAGHYETNYISKDMVQIQRLDINNYISREYVLINRADLKNIGVIRSGYTHISELDLSGSKELAPRRAIFETTSYIPIEEDVYTFSIHGDILYFMAFRYSRIEHEFHQVGEQKARQALEPQSLSIYKSGDLEPTSIPMELYSWASLNRGGYKILVSTAPAAPTIPSVSEEPRPEVRTSTRDGWRRAKGVQRYNRTGEVFMELLREVVDDVSTPYDDPAVLQALDEALPMGWQMAELELEIEK